MPPADCGAKASAALLRTTPTHALRVGQERAAYVLEAIQSSFPCQVESAVGSRPYPVDKLLPVWSSLGPVAMEITSLLENGMFDVNMTSDSQMMTIARNFPNLEVNEVDPRTASARMDFVLKKQVFINKMFAKLTEKNVELNYKG